MRYDTGIDKRTFLLEKMIKLNNPTLVQRAWRSKFKVKKAPTHSYIKSLYEKFKKTGYVADLPKKYPSKAVKREKTKEKIESLVNEKQAVTIRKAAQEADISCSLARLILKDDLNLKPYKIQETFKLNDNDPEARLKFANWALNLTEDTWKWIIHCDEAIFHLTEANNKQNNRVWAAERPETAKERPLHDKKVHIWVAISASSVYGPYYFEGTINGDKYLHMLMNFFWKHHCQMKNSHNYYFMKDGAPAHQDKVVQSYLAEKFGDKFISKDKWPSRSPDLNILLEIHF